MGSTPPNPPPPYFLLKRRMKVCFLCGKNEETGTSELKDFVNEVPSSSSALLHPVFPIPTTAHLPQGIRVCRECECIIDFMNKGITKGHGRDIKDKLRMAMFVASVNQEVFQEDEDVGDLRRLIAFPCDFGWPSSSTYGFNYEDVAGDFGRLPNEVLDPIFRYLDPGSLKSLQQVSSFMRNKTFPYIQVKCPIKILKWIKCDYFMNWPHLKDQSNLELNIVHNVEIPAEDRLFFLFSILREESVKKLTLKFESVKPEIIPEVLNEVFINLPKLEELDLDMDANSKTNINMTMTREYQSYVVQLREKYSGWLFWTSEKPSLKKISLRSFIPDLKGFVEATPNISSIIQYNSDNELLRLLKANTGEGDGVIRWAQLESLNMINMIPPVPPVGPWPIPPPPPPQNIVNSLGPRPIKQLKIEHVDYPNLRDFVELLEKYGDTLEWVEVVIHFRTHSLSTTIPYQELDLPTNLKRLRGFKLTIKDLAEERTPEECNYHYQHLQRCVICTDWRPLEWQQNRRDFLKIGELLKDPALFDDRFPEFRKLSLLVTPPAATITRVALPQNMRRTRSPLNRWPLPPSQYACPTCIKRNHSICESLVPPEAFNRRLLSVELSHPTEREDPVLYSAWRERLAQAFPNAKIEEPPRRPS